MHAGVRDLLRPRQVERLGPVHPVVFAAGGPASPRLRPLRGTGLQQGDRVHERRRLQGTERRCRAGFEHKIQLEYRVTILDSKNVLLT